eukprot:250757-Chlamydomonas_euryale.AAC.8
MSANAGSFSFCTHALSIPIASSAPATTCLSVEYRYLSICGSPPSTSHIVIMPMLAVAAVLPWSRFLKIQCVGPALAPPPAPLLLASLSTVTSLSAPKPALTKALTNVEARFWRAESTAAPAGARPSTRCVLYTSSGVLGSSTSRSRASARKCSLSLELEMTSRSVSCRGQRERGGGRAHVR